MAAAMNTLSEMIVQKSFKDCTVGELQQLTEQYPYFAPAHILLLKKFDPASEEYRRQYNKAILFFHDPLSFEYFLNPDAFKTELQAIADTDDEQIAEELIDAPAAEQVTIPAINLQAEAATDLSFEPFHTVDYFASQGIKLSQDDHTQDKFGKQVKSFTDWLKIMKRLPATEVSKNIDSNAEKKVENLADHSLEAAEIVTESMAEVWMKQGNKQKALEVYEKLSLLNPSKRAYFAAKIQNLNG